MRTALIAIPVAISLVMAPFARAEDGHGGDPGHGAPQWGERVAPVWSGPAQVAPRSGGPVVQNLGNPAQRNAGQAYRGQGRQSDRQFAGRNPGQGRQSHPMGHGMGQPHWNAPPSFHHRAWDQGRYHGHDRRRGYQGGDDGGLAALILGLGAAAIIGGLFAIPSDTPHQAYPGGYGQSGYPGVYGQGW